ncbi:MAG: ThuA domain-containing protein [Bryobacteraceae bacterium]
MRHVRKILPIAAAAFVATAFAQQGADFTKQADGNHDGSITREELESAMTAWLGGKASVSQEEFTKAFEGSFSEGAFMGMISPPQSRTPKPEDVAKMMAALPAAAPAKPAKARKVLVLSKCGGFVHACIPLAAKTIEELGAKTGAWTTTVSYDSAVISADNLKQYDAVFLNNTTGYFLDDADASVTEARKKALLDFVRSGKGLAGMHAASDSYHESTNGPEFVHMMAGGIFTGADKNSDKQMDKAELSAVAAAWFDAIDREHAGKVSEKDFRAGLPRALMGNRRRRAGGGPPAAKAGPDTQVGTWLDFNRMIGGYFKYHWFDPQHIVYKIDDPASPLTAMFKDGFEIDDETYTFGIKSWSRQNLHVLASVDYSKMSDADKAKEDNPRSDHDYGLSWIRREGKGRVFYTAHGHSERVYASRPMLEHVLAGMQYALGDLKANDSPSERAKK